MNPFAWISSTVRSAFRPPPPPPPIRLQVAPELELLRLVASLDDPAPPGDTAPGVAMRLSDSSHVDEVELTRRLAGRVEGEPRPDWAEGGHGAPAYGVCLARASHVIYFPAFGAVAAPSGEVMKSSVAEALYFTPDLSALPGVTLGEDGAAMLQLEGKLESLPSATVFMAWGGRYNYGHFLLDCLPALMAIAEQGLLDRFPAVAPRLDDLQRTLLALMLGERAAAVRETDAETLRIEDVLFATPMDHFLHAPSWPLDRVRAEILSRTPKTAVEAHRIYLSRRRDLKRPMLNEIELETALEALGFVVVHAQDLPVTEQIALFQGADVIVGPTGAGFANALFCKPGAKVFEIQPCNFTGIWVRGVCHFVGAEWYGFFTPSPIEPDDPDAPELAVGADFTWRTPIDSFVDFVRANL